MDAADVRIFQHLAFQLLDQLAVGTDAQQWINRLPDHFDAAPDDQRRNQQPGITVCRKRGEQRQQHRQQHHQRGHDVGKTVKSRGRKHRRPDFPPDRAVEEKHPELDRNRRNQRRNHPRRHLDRFRIPDPLRRTLQKVQTDRNDDHCDHQPGDILHPPVPEGVFIVGRLRGEFEADQRHHRGAGIREVVDRVRHHSDTAGEQSGRHLDAEEQRIAETADPPGRHAAALPDLRVVRTFSFPGHPPQQKFRNHHPPSRSIQEKTGPAGPVFPARSCTGDYSTTTATLIPFILTLISSASWIRSSGM